MQSSAEKGVPPAEAWVSEAALVAELSGMRIRALNARAEELGVPAHKLDEAEDTPDTKGALVSLIVGRMREHESARLAQQRVELGALRIRALTMTAGVRETRCVCVAPIGAQFRAIAAGRS